MDDLVKGAGECGFFGRYGSPPRVGGLKQSRVNHNLVVPGGGFGTELNPKIGVVGKAPGDAGDRRRDALVTLDDGFDRPFRDGKDLAEGRRDPILHNRPLLHTAAAFGPGNGGPPNISGLCTTHSPRFPMACG